MNILEDKLRYQILAVFLSFCSAVAMTLLIAGTSLKDVLLALWMGIAFSLFLIIVGLKIKKDGDPNPSSVKGYKFIFFVKLWFSIFALISVFVWHCLGVYLPQ